MASRYELEVKIQSARDLKNINWKYGTLKPYAVVWIDPKNKSSTKVDPEGDTSPYWDETLVIPFSSPIEDATLHIDVVHVVDADEDTKPLIGSARLRLSEVVDDVGLGESSQRTLQLKRPSGRPQGKVEVKVTVREPRYRTSDSYYAPPYGVPPPGTARDFSAPPPPPMPLRTLLLPILTIQRLRRPDTPTAGTTHRLRTVNRITGSRRTVKRVMDSRRMAIRRTTGSQRRRRRASTGWERDWRWVRLLEFWVDWPSERASITWRTRSPTTQRRGLRMTLATAMKIFRSNSVRMRVGSSHLLSGFRVVCLGRMGHGLIYVCLGPRIFGLE